MGSHTTALGHAAPANARPGYDTETTLHTLLVEDHVATAEALAVLLTAEGHQVRIAPDGETALRAAEEEPPDVALLDLGLPGIDGYEVAQRLCQQGQEKRPLIVASDSRPALKSLLRKEMICTLFAIDFSGFLNTNKSQVAGGTRLAAMQWWFLYTRVVAK